MGEQDKAEGAFREALKRDPELSLNAKQVKPEMVELLARVRNGVRGYLSVSADGDATVQLDGEGVGRAPYEVLVPVGPHRVVVRCAGGERAKRVVVRHGATARFAARCVVPGGGAAAASGDARDGMARRPRLWTWVVAGTAVAALGVAIGLGASASADYSEFEDLLASGRRDETRREELESAIQSKSLGANVMFGVAGGLAATAVVLFFLEGRAPARKQTARAAGLQLMVGPVTGLGLRLPF